MNNSELKKFKKHYGEKFAKFCRDSFPTILQQEGLLFDMISSKFAYDKDLYESLDKWSKQDDFRAYFNTMYREKFKTSKSSVEEMEVLDSPKELMKKAGYTLCECKSNKDVMSFKKYWHEYEELCTFNDQNRIEKSHIFFAIKGNVNKIKREDFKNPLRQDEYGTSVISLQFTKGIPMMLSIKNRYNYAVVDCDATFSNDLENIQAGLTKSFEKEYNFNLETTRYNIELYSHIMANDGKLYNFKYEDNNIYYCKNNIIIDGDRNVIKLNSDNQLLIENFILDLENKTIYSASEYEEVSNKRYNRDCFASTIGNNIKNIAVNKHEEGKTITINFEDEKDVIIEINKQNSIVKYINPNVETINDDFLKRCQSLEHIELENVEKVGRYFLRNRTKLNYISAPKLEETGDGFLYNAYCLTNAEFPNLKSVGSSCLAIKRLTNFSAPKLTTIGYGCFDGNKTMAEKAEKIIMKNGGLIKECGH